ncbi:MAG: hypothetical protein KDC03_21635, partial [Flavobacteriales bacterium]|nr:hypothetical protein [Flavobacteriales bacterium]
MWRNFWDTGIVEPVSSGSPLFDQNKRIIGHMTEGAQNCSNASTVATGCAKFSASWDGASPTSRLRDWLDPSNSVQQLDAFLPGSQSAGVRVRPRVMLAGCYDPASFQMKDGLRQGGFIPLTEPYSAAGHVFVDGGGESTSAGVLSVSGSTAVVDWVIVELRDKTNAGQVVSSQAALLLRNGEVVATDGLSDLEFPVVQDDYHVAVLHRNHLPFMTQSPVALAGGVIFLDVAAGQVAPFGGWSRLRAINGMQCLYAGDVTGDAEISYLGSGNDRDPVLSAIGGTVPTNAAAGYLDADVDLDGEVRYTGTRNDRDPILLNIGGTDPSAVREGQLP